MKLTGSEGNYRVSASSQHASLRVVPAESSKEATASELTGRRSGDGGGSITNRRAPLAIQIKDGVLQYPIGAFDRGSVKSAVMSMFGTRKQATTSQFIHALRGVNIEVQQGERVALIGHNGSGKSTLLRAMAGIYPLVSGSIRVSGRIGTLLDLGVGFEQEATGRENIYNRGMAMGYSRRVLARHEQEIVDFCGLGDFIDLPVRTYSAGMYVRLAFAISTQFSPEVLLVDEVFGAGDATFQERARQRMLNIVSNAGIFIIATHDLNLVQAICTRAIWLEAGRIVSDGPVGSVLPEYTARPLGE